MIDYAILFCDGAILAWLVGTWFYEGHHRQCRVDVSCPRCGETTSRDCDAGKR